MKCRIILELLVILFFTGCYNREQISRLDEAEALADRVAVINHGKIIEVATPTTLGNRQNALALVKWRDGESESHQPTEFVKELSAKYNGEVPELQVIRPSLEDIYLRMIGE